MDTLTAPCFSPFHTSHDDNRKQDSPLINLPSSILDNIISHIPLKVRTLMVAPACRALRDSVYRSITSVAFYKTQLDELSDTRIKYFLSIHGHKITAINFDLFRSVEDVACTQWNWRQSVITAVKMCSNLRELDILVCKRHRLRDTDLLTVAPVGLQRLELEMCLRLSETAMRSIFSRLKKLKVLYVSDLRILKDSIISGLVSNLKNLRDLSIIANPETPNMELSASALGHLARLPRLQNLCLEGLPAVTDRIGLQRLARMPKLDSLNLDGITKRDISSGLEKIAVESRLVRLLLAEGTNVSCDTLREVAQWVISGRPPLTVLTNKHLPWGMITIPQSFPESTPPVFSVVHLHRNTVPMNEILPGSVLSEENSSQLPHGLLLARLRRGNRYRLLHSLRSLSQEGGDSDDQKENSCSPTHQRPLRKGKSPKSPANVPLICSPPPLPLFAGQQTNIHSPNALTTSPIINQTSDLANCLGACAPLQTPQLILPELCPGAFPSHDLGRLVPSDTPLEPWMMWLAANASYTPSALTFTDPLSMLTAGSAGAPRPPVEIPQQPRFHYTRGPRNKRRSNPQKHSPQAAAQPVSFSPTDFPPLQ
ncbi:hypothetical protein NECAME_09568 [Necator americanus]|uniref:F-box domain protein n=1 Tax=Necator americanus TaxID=51031 RepID=W2TDH5_NECAM|nr:hypothetical protein NECAME_09568 [Necator americanus]ETN79868.1 hypothetical protein NECAME_09568 [Necator americanus]